MAWSEEFPEALTHPLETVPVPKPHYDSVDPFTHRYFDAEANQIFTEDARIAYQGLMEAALARGLVKQGVIEAGVADAIEASRYGIDAQEVTEHERAVTKHDIRALGDIMRQGLPEGDQRWLHFAATSYDIISNASALQYRDAMDLIILPRTLAAMEELANLVEEHAGTPQVGRTHLQNGVPTTFGHAVAKTLHRLDEAFPKLVSVRDGLRGKFSGAVGAYNSSELFVDDPLALEKDILEEVGLEPAEYSTQVVMPDQTVRLANELKTVSAILANLGRDIRLLAATEISEVEESFSANQVGSSTMAQKKNPINAENIEGFLDLANGLGVMIDQQMMTDLQRDLTDSAPSRFNHFLILTVARQLKTARALAAGLGVFPERMMHNMIETTHGAIAGEPLYLILQRYGVPDGHTVSKQIAHSMEEGELFGDKAPEHPVVKQLWDRFTDAERAAIVSPQINYLGAAEEVAKDIAMTARRTIAAYRKSQ